MTVKNNIIFVAMAIAASVALAGCHKDPVLDPDDEWAELCGDKPLRFSSAVMPTKADSPLVNGATFGVFAFLQEGDVMNGTVAHWSVDRSPNFMFNQLVTKTGATNSNQHTDYTYSPLRYWPENEENTISFWAYSPHNPSAVLYETGTTNAYTRSSTGLPDIEFSVTNGRDDFMVSNLMVDRDYSMDSGIVPFEFRHRLAWIEFQAKTAADYTPVGQTITVTSVQIYKDYSTGIYRQASSSWNSYSAERTQANAVSAFSGNVELEYTEPKSCSSFPVLMLPQNMDHGNGNKVTVIVKYNQRIGNFNVSKEVPVELDIVPQFDAWAPNKKYVYTFEITSSDAINLNVQVQPWEYWLGTSDYTESVSITKQLTWDPDTFEAGTGSNCTEVASFTIDGETKSYKVLVLKPGTNLKGSFIFDTPYLGTWYAMLEPINGSNDGSILFNNNSVLLDGLVGNESTIEIKAAGTATSAQYAVLRFMCRTVPVNPDDPSTSQTLYVNPDLLGGQYVIKQNIN